jgi:hypothetical protein
MSSCMGSARQQDSSFRRSQQLKLRNMTGLVGG